MNLNNLLYFDNTILDGVENVPAGIDVSILRAEIVMQCGLLRPVYPEPEVFKELCRQFFISRQWEFQHLINIINAEYSPIENVFEEREETRDTTRGLDRNDKRDISKDISAKEDISGEDSTDRSESGTSSNNGTTEKQVSAFDSSAYQPSEKSLSNASANSSTSGSEEKSYNEDRQRSEKENTKDSLQGREDEQTKDTFKVLRHGNIGVTTNFELIQGELGLLKSFNIYKWIALQFRAAMMIEVF